MLSKLKRKEIPHKPVSDILYCEYTGPFRMLSRQLESDVKKYLSSFKRDDEFEIRATFVVEEFASKLGLSRYGWKIAGASFFDFRCAVPDVERSAEWRKGSVSYADYNGKITETLSSVGLKKCNIDPEIWSFIRPDMREHIRNMYDYTFTIKITMRPMIKKVAQKDAALIAAEIEASPVLRQELSDFGVKVTLK
jgi:hypothetical protein